MALPNLTAEQRADALRKAAEVRKSRAKLKDDLKSGKLSLGSVLDRASTDPVVGKMRVKSLLLSLPRIGAVKAEEIMSQFHIAENRRVAGLGTRQVAELREYFSA